MKPFTASYLEPRFAALKHFQSSRLFQNQTVPDIAAAVFKHHGFSGVDYRFQKSRSYSVREYVTQYLESDFAFINRLCEEEGIWYAFEQHGQHGDVVVFGDSPEHYFRDPSLPVSYRPHAGLESVGTEALFNLSIRHNPVVEGIRSADYNYRSADTDLFAETDNKQSEESADNTVLLGKQQNWGFHPKTPDEAKVQTTLLNEAVLCRQTVAAGGGNVVSMAPMKVFQTDTAFPEAPDGWLVLSMEHIKLATDYQKSQLNLGHIVDSNRNKRWENGEGFELRTDGWGAVRAGKGILVSAQNQDANGKVLDMDDAISQLEQALSLAKSLNKAAQTANNHNTDEATQRGRLKDALKDLKEAGLIQTAPAGIATATQQSQLHTAGENIHLVSGSHTDISAGQSLTAHAAESLNLFAQSSGIKVQANQGKVEVQAQNDELQLNALKDATLTSSAGKITIAAKEEILITCKGAYIKLSNGEVEIGSPKVVRVRAPMVVSGPNSAGVNMKGMPAVGRFSLHFILKDSNGNILRNTPYKISDGNSLIRGITNRKGKTQTIYSDSPDNLVCEEDWDYFFKKPK